jgi:hypothetical protein
MITSAQENLAVSGIKEPIGAVAADNGYWSQQSATVDVGPDLFIATRTKGIPHSPLL